ncbi:ExbD/TolR family protein [Roseibium sp. SCP14]|uniref:ExbD/TolR family protein n=1 Tax=Roseibium sp. SCP14 TaxID=3141375 RepID=UPI00333D7560
MKRYTKPIHLPKPLVHRPADSSLALINVVFLLLLFLLVAGTLRPPLPEDFEWAETTVEEGSGDIQRALVLTKDGELWFEGEPLDRQGVADFLKNLGNNAGHLSIQVDKRAKMAEIASLADLFQANGVRRLTLVTVEKEQP